MFTTDRLMFRTLSREVDYQRLHMWMNTAEYQSILPDGMFPTNAASEDLDYLFSSNARALGSLPVFAICLKPADAADATLTPTEYFTATPLVGLLNYIPTSQRLFRNREASLGIAFVPGHQGHGYGQEALRFASEYAFKELGLHRLLLQTRADNTAALKCYQKVGFQVEGRARQKLFSASGWVDEVSLGLLEHEWYALRKQAGDVVYNTKTVVDFTKP